MQTFTIIDKSTNEKEVHEAITQVIFHESFLSAELTLVDINGYSIRYTFDSEDLMNIQIQVNDKIYSLYQFRNKYKEDERREEARLKEEKRQKEINDAYWRKFEEEAEHRAWNEAYHDTGWPEDDAKEATKNMWRYYRLSHD